MGSAGVGSFSTRSIIGNDLTIMGPIEELNKLKDEEAKVMTIKCKAVLTSESGGEVRIQVHAGDAGVFRGRGTNAVGLAEHVVPDIAEAEIGQQVGLHVVVKPACDRVIP